MFQAMFGECHRTPQKINMSIFVRVMVWCCQATSHCLGQGCSRLMAPYGITRTHEWTEPLSLSCMAKGTQITGDHTSDHFKKFQDTWSYMMSESSLWDTVRAHASTPMGINKRESTAMFGTLNVRQCHMYTQRITKRCITELFTHSYIYLYANWQ